jgi:hypothetical protein
MVGIPQAFSAAQVPFGSGAMTGASAESAQMDVSRGTICAAKSTYAAIPFEHFFTQVSRIGAQLPFVNAPIRTECRTAGRDFEVTPAAEISPVGTLFEPVPIDPPAGHRPLGTHKARISFGFRQLLSSQLRQLIIIR